MSPPDLPGPLPNFLLIGAQKAGSSTLHDYLSLHPQVFMSRGKELHYFDDGYQTSSFDRYRSHFSDANGAIRIGESTPAYLSYPGCAEKIRALLGDIPIVVILRDPVKRMVSQYWHAVKYGHEDEGFRAALDAERHRRDRMGMRFFRQFDYLSRSAYETHLVKYRALFGCVHVCRLEDLSRDPLPVLNGICDALGLDPFKSVADRPPSNPSKMARSQTVNRVLNALEERLGANRATRVIRNRNFKPFSYPPISDADRAFALARLSEICPDTVRLHVRG